MDDEIEIISKSEIRYIGHIAKLNTADETLTLRNVRSFGTEDRPSHHFVPQGHNVYATVLFKFANLRVYKKHGEWHDIQNLYKKSEAPPAHGPYNYRKSQRFLEAEVPEAEYELGTDEGRGVDPEELKRASKKYYDGSRGFYDDFTKR